MKTPDYLVKANTEVTSVGKDKKTLKPACSESEHINFYNRIHVSCGKYPFGIYVCRAKSDGSIVYKLVFTVTLFTYSKYCKHEVLQMSTCR